MLAQKIPELQKPGWWELFWEKVTTLLFSPACPFLVTVYLAIFTFLNAAVLNEM